MEFAILGVNNVNKSRNGGRTKTNWNMKRTKINILPNIKYSKLVRVVL